MSAVATSTIVSADGVSVRAATWRGAPDWALLAGLAASAFAIGMVDIAASERVIPATALVAVAVGWVRSLSQRWTIAGNVVHRGGWLMNRSVEVDRDTDLSLSGDGEIAEELVIRRGRTAITVPLHAVGGEPRFAAELARLAHVANASAAVQHVLGSVNEQHATQ